MLQAEELHHPMIKMSSAGGKKQLEKNKISFQDTEKEVLVNAVAMLC